MYVRVCMPSYISRDYYTSFCKGFFKSRYCFSQTFLEISLRFFYRNSFLFSYELFRIFFPSCIQGLSQAFIWKILWKIVKKFVWTILLKFVKKFHLGLLFNKDQFFGDSFRKFTGDASGIYPEIPLEILTENTTESMHCYFSRIF